MQSRVLLKVVNPNVNVNVNVEVTYMNFSYKNIWMGLRLRLRLSLRLDLPPLVKHGPGSGQSLTKISGGMNSFWYIFWYDLVNIDC